MYAPTTYWSNPPPPFLPSSQYAPVPGWGANPAVAGPARVGVGAFGQTAQKDPTSSLKLTAVQPSALQVLMTSQEGATSPDEQVGTGMKVPWWYFVTGAMVLGAGAALAYNLGWIGK